MRWLPPRFSTTWFSSTSSWWRLARRRGRPDQRAEQPAVADQLGVPLDSQHETAGRVFHRLGQPVLGVGRDGQRTGVGDTLVVEAVNGQVVAEQVGDPAAR